MRLARQRQRDCAARQFGVSGQISAERANKRQTGQIGKGRKCRHVCGDIRGDPDAPIGGRHVKQAARGAMRRLKRQAAQHDGAVRVCLHVRAQSHVRPDEGGQRRISGRINAARRCAHGPVKRCAGPRRDLASAIQIDDTHRDPASRQRLSRAAEPPVRALRRVKAQRERGTVQFNRRSRQTNRAVALYIQHEIQLLRCAVGVQTQAAIGPKLRRMYAQIIKCQRAIILCQARHRQPRLRPEECARIGL